MIPDPAARAFHLLAKPIGPICNLDCAYCFYLQKEALYPGRTRRADWAMGDAVLEAFVRQFIDSQPGDVVNFAWQGGEPTLLGLDFFRRVVAVQQRYAGGRVIDNALQTNGVLLDDEWGAFLAEQRFLVGVSIDGPRHVHDPYRPDKGGRPTFDAVVRGIEALQKAGVDFNTLTVVHRHSADHAIEIYRFLKGIGSRFLQFIPIVERASDHPSPSGPSLARPDAIEAPVTPWSVAPGDYGTFLCAIFDEWVRQDVGRIAVQTFEVALESWLGLPQSVCLYRETCGGALAIEHNGDVYSCDHYVYPSHRLGNVVTDALAAMVGSGMQVRFGEAKRDDLPAYCRSCEVRFACHGECPKNRFAWTPDGEPGLNYLCPSYKQFFTHIGPAMRMLSGEIRAGRPASNVMAWMRSRETGPDGRG